MPRSNRPSLSTAATRRKISFNLFKLVFPIIWVIYALAMIVVYGTKFAVRSVKKGTGYPPPKTTVSKANYLTHTAQQKYYRKREQHQEKIQAQRAAQVKGRSQAVFKSLAIPETETNNAPISTSFPPEKNKSGKEPKPSKKRLKKKSYSAGSIQLQKEKFASNPASKEIPHLPTKKSFVIPPKQPGRMQMPLAGKLDAVVNEQCMSTTKILQGKLAKYAPLVIDIPANELATATEATPYSSNTIELMNAWPENAERIASAVLNNTEEVCLTQPTFFSRVTSELNASAPAFQPQCDINEVNTSIIDDEMVSPRYGI